MTTFTDGPAAGTTLSLRRAPLFLRAVQDADGNWDALDQVDDQPAAEETITAYRRVGASGYVCLRMPKGSGRYAVATYVLHDVQPPIEVCRDRAKWQAWASEEAIKLPEVKDLAEQLAEAISPCCVCGKAIAADEPAAKEGDAYRHKTCEPKGAVPT